MNPHRLPKESAEQEILSRARRIETRLTQLMIGLGVSTQAHKPTYDAASHTLTVPSIHSSLKEILDSIPENCHDDVAVRLGDSVLIWVSRAGD